MESDSGPKGLGGWLILIGIDVVLAPLWTLLTAIPLYWSVLSDGTWQALMSPASPSHNVFLGSVFIFELCFHIAALSAEIYQVRLFFLKNHKFPRVFIALLLAFMVFVPLDSVLVALALRAGPAFDHEAKADMASLFIYSLILVPYMLNSKRVRNTFVRGLSGYLTNSRVDSGGLTRRARRAGAAALIFQSVGGAFLGLGLMGAIGEAVGSYSTGSSLTTRSGAHETSEVGRTAAYRRIGTGLFFLTCGAANLVFAIISRRSSKQWAAIAYDILSQSEEENIKVLERCRDSGRNFALYLRGFEQEFKESRRMPRVPLADILSGKLRSRPLLRATRWVESEIVKELARWGLEVFCLGRPGDLKHPPGAHRIASSSRKWIKTVEGLAQDAQFIVLYIAESSEGLLAEVAALRRLEVTNKTVVVCGRMWVDRGNEILNHFPTSVTIPRVWPWGLVSAEKSFRSRYYSALITAFEESLGRSRPCSTPLNARIVGDPRGPLK